MPVIFEPPNFVARLGGAVRPQSAGFLGVVTQKVAIIPQIDVIWMRRARRQSTFDDCT
jgi:hypothetical protein